MTSFYSPSPHYSDQEIGELHTITFNVEGNNSDLDLGFNIRGGAEFSLGIFISCITEGSIAEKVGFHVGDKIISINGISFEGFNHQEAVDLITSLSNFCVCVRATGKVPAEVQIIPEYAWDASNSEVMLQDTGIMDDPHETDHYSVTATEDSFPPQSPRDSDNSPGQNRRDSDNSLGQNRRDSDNSLGQNRRDSDNSLGQNPNCTPKTEEKVVQEDSPKSKKEIKSSKKKQSKSKKKKKNDSVKNKSQAEHTLTQERDNLVSKMSEKLQQNFSFHEYGTIRQSIARYHDGEKVEDLLNNIIHLFPPKKYILLRDIREVVYKNEVDKYDNIVNAYLQKMVNQALKRTVLPGIETKPPIKVRPGQMENVLRPMKAVPREKVNNNEHVIQPVKSSYKTKNPLERSKDNAPVCDQPFNHEPYILYDKNKQPIHKLNHVVRLTQSTPTRIHDVVTKTHDAVTKTHDVVDSTPLIKQTTAPTKIVVLETTNVSNEARNESIEVTREKSPDNMTISVHKTTPKDTKDQLVTIDKSRFDKERNTVVVNATLNTRKASPPKQAPPPKQAVEVPTQNVENKSENIIEIVKSHTSREKPKPIVPRQNSVLVELIQSNTPSEESKSVVSKNVIEVVKAHSSPIKQDPPYYTYNTEESYNVEYSESVQKTCSYNIDKSHQYIGLSITGGADSRYQREIKIVSVNPLSASSIAGLQVGQVLLAIDEHDLTNVTHSEACKLIQSTFRDKSNNVMVVNATVTE